MATWEDLAEFVQSGTPDETFVQACWTTAMDLVDQFVGDAVIAASVLDRCYLSTGSELFHQRNAPHGVAAFNGYDGAPVRINRDPMTAAYAILSAYMVIGL